MTISIFLNGQNCQQVSYDREDVFEKFIVDNAETIFGENSIYIDLKHKIENTSFGGTIPDGILINLSDLENPVFYLVEVELQTHDFFKHIFPQITKFFAFYKNSSERQKLTEKIFSIFRQDDVLKNKLKERIGSKEIYKFLKDTLESSQNILIIIDGLKSEFQEIIDTYTDTWGKMVKIQIINHFLGENQNIITAEPPFQNLEFEDAILSSPDKETSEPSQYTEEFHLDGCEINVKNIYNKLKSEFVNIKSTLRFNPVKFYIGVRDNKNLAAIRFRKTKLLLELGLPEDKVNLESKYHKIRLYASRWPMVEINDMSHWDEIQKLIIKLIEKNQDV